MTVIFSQTSLAGFTMSLWKRAFQHFSSYASRSHGLHTNTPKRKMKKSIAILFDRELCILYANENVRSCTKFVPSLDWQQTDQQTIDPQQCLHRLRMRVGRGIDRIGQPSIRAESDQTTDWPTDISGYRIACTQPKICLEVICLEVTASHRHRHMQRLPLRKHLNPLEKWYRTGINLINI